MTSVSDILVVEFDVLILYMLILGLKHESDYYVTENIRLTKQFSDYTLGPGALK